MSARPLIEHALRVYYADSRDPNGLVDKLLARYDAELRAESDEEKDTRDGSSHEGESTPCPPRPHALPESSFARARQCERIGGYFRCVSFGRTAAAEMRAS